MNWPWQRKFDTTFDAGAVYRCTESRRVIETATVMARFNDYDGIPHIRYTLRLDLAFGEPDSEEMRVLSEAAFALRYSEYSGGSKPRNTAASAPGPFMRK